MNQNFLVGAPGLFSQLCGNRFRSTDARAEHAEILLRPFLAFPKIADLGARAGNDLEQIVQFAGRFRK